MGGLRVTHAVMDEAALWTPERIGALRALVPTPSSAALFAALLARRRAALIEQVEARYGVTLYPDPRHEHIVRLSASDYAWLLDAVWHDRGLDAIGRGYYLGLGGELTLVPVADWTCDPLTVALARFTALGLYRPLQPVLRALTALTRRITPKPRPTGKGRSDR